ncbi:hypothetical protein ASC58_12195 [Phycicoccus sp. Root101]|nr:hypothetical protein ASC58_12195 [Phycicoccus sp. Root101]
MDASIQAAFIGVFGSLLGASVGGALATISAARTAQRQWDRERANRHEEAIGREMEALMRAAGHALSTEGNLDVAPLDLPITMLGFMTEDGAHRDLAKAVENLWERPTGQDEAGRTAMCVDAMDVARHHLQGKDFKDFLRDRGWD